MFEKFRVTQHHRRISALPLLSSGANRVLWRGSEYPTSEVLDDLTQHATSGISHETTYAEGMLAEASIVEKSHVLEIKKRTAVFFYPTSGLVEITPVQPPIQEQ